MPIEVLCQAPQQSSHMLDNIDRFITDFANTVGRSVRDNVVDTKTFWETAEKLLIPTDFSNELQREATIAKFQSYLSYVEEIPVSYHSRQGSKDIVLSGKIYIPRQGPIWNIILAHHYTIGANREAPSQTCTFEALLAAKGYVVLMPDYLGFGITKDSIHPYLSAAMTSQASVDMLNASIGYLYDRDIHVVSPQLILCGYSQGAAASLATQRLIETSYPEYTIRHNYVGAGPYSPADTYDYCVRMNKTSIPCAIPMLLQGMLVSEHLDYSVEDMLLPPLRDHYQEWINSKEYNMYQINDSIGSKYINQIISPLALDKTLYPTNTFYAALQRNKIDNWTPVADIYMFHSTEDDMVPFVNSEIMQQFFDSLGVENVVYDFMPYGVHMKAALVFFRNLYNNL